MICKYCNNDLDAFKRVDSVFCSSRCRKRFWYVKTKQRRLKCT